jgi:hypothetical protein
VRLEAMQQGLRIVSVTLQIVIAGAAVVWLLSRFVTFRRSRTA